MKWLKYIRRALCVGGTVKMAIMMWYEVSNSVLISGCYSPMFPTHSYSGFIPNPIIYHKSSADWYGGFNPILPQKPQMLWQYPVEIINTQAILEKQLTHDRLSEYVQQISESVCYKHSEKNLQNKAKWYEILLIVNRVILHIHQTI